jgi:GntR family transcriptional regulator/MocR family aminotransferase
VSRPSVQWPSPAHSPIAPTLGNHTPFSRHDRLRGCAPRRPNDCALSVRYPRALRLPVVLDRERSLPLSRQIVEQITAAVERGVLAEGDELPSSRTVAQVLYVSRGVALSAYAELSALGYLRSEPGSATFVAPRPPAGESPTQTAGRRPVRPEVIDFAPGRPNLEQFPLVAWRSAWQRVTYRLPVSSAPNPFGESQLQAHLARYATRTRGLPCRPCQVFVTGGAAHGLELLARLFVRPDVPAVVEDPANPLVAATLRRFGPVAALTVDCDGACVDTLPARASLVVVSPSHQFPLGGRLPLTRRRALLDWATANGALVVELDAADELHDPQGYLPSLGLLGLGEAAPVAHLGSLDQVFTPELGLGYLIVPEKLIRPLAVLYATEPTRPPVLAQRVMEQLFDSGEVEHYVDRLCHVLQRKRLILQDRLGKTPHGCLRGTDGTHAVLDLSDGLSAGAVSADLMRRGVSIPVAASYYQFLPADRNALILGFSHLSDDDLQHGVTELEGALEGCLLS